jgi:hypothetical protein
MADVFERDVYERRGGRVRLSPHQTLGWRIFLVVAILVAGMTVLVSLEAWLTYPALADVPQPPGSTAAENYKLWRDAKSEWQQQVVGIAQLALFGSLIPLLGTIAGYLLGQRAAAAAREDEADTV